MAYPEKTYFSRQFFYTEGFSFVSPTILQPEMRTFWPCNGFLSPIVPGPNMPLPIPYAVPLQHPTHIYPQPNMQPMMTANMPQAPPPGFTVDFRSGIRSRFYQRMEEERVNVTHFGYEDVPIINQNDQSQNVYQVASENDSKEPNLSPRASSTVNSSDSDPLNMPLGFSAARLAGDSSSNGSSVALCNESICNKSHQSESAVFNGDGTVTISESKYNELTRLALNGSEIAEKLAFSHRNRPCFKKIDSLCARMKQDLLRPDGVLPNINSQGIAWAIKDFIFVFTRIISAWIIIKGYVFNTPEGLDKVKSVLCPDFVARFLVWQDATYDFADSLVRSFVNLDILAQSQKTSHQKSNDNYDCNVSSPTKSHSGTNPHNFDDKFELYERRLENTQPTNSNLNGTINKNYLYTLIKDSENSQREATVNGTYFKTGTYRPIIKETYREEAAIVAAAPVAAATANSPTLSNKHTEATNSRAAQFTQPPALLKAAPIAFNSSNAADVNVSSVTESELSTQSDSHILEASEVLNDYFNEELYQRLANGDINIPMVEHYLREHLPTNWVVYGIRMFWRMFAERSLQPNSVIQGTSVVQPAAFPASFSTIANSNQNMSNTLSLLLKGVLSIRSSDLFFKMHFAKNYFPKFIAKYQDKITDLRTIALKTESCGYAHVFELVHDIRRIFYYAKIYLEFNVDPNLLKAVNAFENEFDGLLHSQPFNIYRFDHIIGDPQENLYLVNTA